MVEYDRNDGDNREDDRDDALDWVRRAYAETPLPTASARDAVVRDAIVAAARSQRSTDTPRTTERPTVTNDVTRRSNHHQRYVQLVVGGLLAAACGMIAFWGTRERPAEQPEPQSHDTSVAQTPQTQTQPTPNTTVATENPKTIASRDLTIGVESAKAHPSIPAPGITPSPVAQPVTPIATPSMQAPPPDGPSRDVPSRDVPKRTQTEYAAVVAGLDSASATAIIHILDTAAAQALPMSTLTARVREGVRRNVPGPRIVAVAQNYATALADARAAIGHTASRGEIQAGAEAMVAGAPVSALRQLRNARPTGTLAEPLLALADLASHGIPPVQASNALASVIARGGSDTQIRALRAGVIRDIVKGVPPNAALMGRLQTAGGAAGGAVQPPSSGSTRPPLNGNADSMQIRRGTP